MKTATIERADHIATATRDVVVGTGATADVVQSKCALSRKPRRAKVRRGVSDAAIVDLQTRKDVAASKVGHVACESHRDRADHPPPPKDGGEVSGGQAETDTHASRAPEGGHSRSDTQFGCAAQSVDRAQLSGESHTTTSPIDALCSSLVVPDRQRRAAIKTTLMLTNQLAAYARSMMGWSASDKERDKIKDRSAALVKSIIKDEPSDEDPAIIALVRVQYNAVKPSLEALESIRKEADKDMRSIAEKLPAIAWVKSTTGFGVGNFAYVIAATGNLSGYANPAKVWKRMGLAVMSGDRQGAPKSKSAEDYTAHGYNKGRRSVAWNLQSCLLRQGEKCPYYPLFKSRREYELPRVKSDGHATSRALRYMVKRVLADLWSEWRKDANRGE